MYKSEYGSLDFAKSPVEIVLDLIYIQNKVKFYPQRTTIGKPTELDTRPDIDWDENTLISVSVDSNADKSDDNTGSYTYHRPVFGEAGLQRFPSSLTGKTVWEILPEINAAYHVNLSEADVANDPIPSNGLLVLRALKGSLVWQGESNVGIGDFLLETVELSGLAEYAA